MPARTSRSGATTATAASSEATGVRGPRKRVRQPARRSTTSKALSAMSCCSVGGQASRASGPLREPGAIESAARRALTRSLAKCSSATSSSPWAQPSPTPARKGSSTSLMAVSAETSASTRSSAACIELTS